MNQAFRKRQYYNIPFGLDCYNSEVVENINTREKKCVGQLKYEFWSIKLRWFKIRNEQWQTVMFVHEERGLE